MLKYTLISYLILLIVMVFMLNKFVDMKNGIEEKVLGSYMSQMEMINEETGMKVYNLENKELSPEELELLNEIY